MPAISELARTEAEVQSPAPLARAVIILRNGGSLPRSLVRDLLDEGHDITGLIRSITPNSSHI
ncbi:MAG TPA: hypothetical protein VNR89_03950 [Roseomonas sp.]|nr:hypothetical protein [Roseomonas sp.]